MPDPISDVGEVDEDEAPECAVCGRPIVNDPAHRVLTWVDDGEAKRRDFCGDACLEEWKADHDAWRK